MNKIEKAIQALKYGELIIAPTETVYGLVADPFNEEAVNKLFKIKQRDKNKALTIHIAAPEDAHIWAKDISKEALSLIQQHWPGPLTLILHKADDISENITCGKQTIGLRCPDHPIAHELIKAMGHGLIMTSVNISGENAAVSTEQIPESIKKQVAMIIDDGPCQHQISSTIIDATADHLKVLRQGVI